MSGLQGTGILVVAAALGALVTVATKHDPGPLLGGFVVAGTLAAGFAVRPRSAYVLIPIPVLCYLIFALAAGLGREELNSSTSGLTVDAAQWIANGFLTMAGATVLAVLITLGRRLWARHASPAGAGARTDPAARRHPAAEQSRAARLEAETRSRPADPPSAARAPGGTPPEPSFRPDPSWTDDRWPGPEGQGARWAQQDESGGRGYRDERGFGGQGDGSRAREDRGRGDQHRSRGDQWGRGGDPGDGFWDGEARDRRWRRTGREPGDQGQGDWRRRPPSGPPSFGSRDLASGA
jgi:hypothetical protein